jgi:4-amino-4-deoxy-L-arabinose transferase-like glycosyltransferase
MSAWTRINGALARLTDALGDPARRRRAVLGVVVAYAVAWTLYGIIAKSSQDMNADMAEMVVWARELALGYPKHPPLLGWVVFVWFSVFPPADWAYTLLAVVTVSAGIYLAFELCGEWLEGEKRAAVPFLLALIPFYNFLGLKFDQNSTLIPLWALAMWTCLRALRTRHLGWAALAGLAAASAMLAKYWSVFLLVALALAALLQRDRKAYFRSAAPWVTAGVFLLIVAPHAIWLVQENFPPIRWVATRRTAGSALDFFSSLGEYLGGTLGYAAIPLLLGLVLLKPPLPAVIDTWFPRDDRRVAAILFWVPILLPVLIALPLGTRLLSLWNAPAYNLLPVMMLGSALILVTRAAVVRMATVAAVVTLLALIASPVVAYVTLKAGVENHAAYARLVMQAAEREWKQTTDKPLRLVAGPFVLVSSAAFYGSDKPSTFADFSRYLSPWADDARIAREGMAILCPADFDHCLQVMANYQAAYGGRRAELTLARRWLGFEGPPARFVVATIPSHP